jgi:two-component system, OmpR family, response regulator
MTQKKVLIVEDDKTLQDVLRYNLVKEGYNVLTASDGSQAVDIARAEKPELIILDLMLPHMNGLEVCRILRKEMTVPILMLTAKSEEIDKIIGLEVGADDYMTKPFSIRELLARTRAMLRRTEMAVMEQGNREQSEISLIQAGNLEIDLSRHLVNKNGVPVELNPKEFNLLVFLARNKSQVFSRDALLEKVWGYDYAGDTRTVDVHIRWLRQKIEENPNSPGHLVTIRGVGYKFEEKSEK